MDGFELESMSYEPKSAMPRNRGVGVRLNRNDNVTTKSYCLGSNTSIVTAMPNIPAIGESSWARRKKPLRHYPSYEYYERVN